MLKQNGIKVDGATDESSHGKQLNGYLMNNCEVHVKNGRSETDVPEVIFLEISAPYY